VDVTPDGTRVYVADAGINTGDVRAIDTASNTVVATINLGELLGEVEIACFGDPAHIVDEYIGFTVLDRTRDFARFVPDCGYFTGTARSSYCTAPGFLDTEQDVIVIDSALASFSHRGETAIWGNTQIAAPLAKSAL